MTNDSLPLVVSAIHTALMTPLLVLYWIRDRKIKRLRREADELRRAREEQERALEAQRQAAHRDLEMRRYQRWVLDSWRYYPNYYGDPRGNSIIYFDTEMRIGRHKPKKVNTYDSDPTVYRHGL